MPPLEVNQGRILTAESIENAAKRCGATVTVTEYPPGLEGPGSENDPTSLSVSVDRASSQSSIDCFNKIVPTVSINLVGRDPKLPPPLPITGQAFDALLKECKWRKSDGVMRYIVPDEIQMRPKPSADFGRLNCVLEGVRNRFDVKMGFVGNEAYGEEKK